MGLENVQNYIIGVILFIAVIVCGVFIIGNAVSQDPSIDAIGQVNQFNTTLNKASEVTSSVNRLDRSIQSVSKANVGILGWLNALVGAIFSGLQAIGSTFSFMGVAAQEAALFFNIPVFVIPLLLLIVTVIIIFAIYSAITKV